ncbi:hypothetical protein KP78_30320 [Jeotgalibacillus soli]|uniref:Uncharacterized protein n=1 Tax=Jeotgalibacillus soli TaxID=889306 RepID=A0A0C2VNA9_9BACL|nr:hypothetical protein KP78_30320 [Jeotgalibacillus soli]
MTKKKPAYFSLIKDLEQINSIFWFQTSDFHYERVNVP